MNAAVNTKVRAEQGTISMGTMYRYETIREGEIVKVNEKSISVQLDTEIKTKKWKN